MNAMVLEATSLDKSYGRIGVLRDVSLTIGAGESHVVIGPNGAGKTTLFKVLTGELYADRGAVHFQGRDVTRVPAHKRVHLGFGRTFQVAKVFSKLSVQDNLLIALEARVRRQNPLARVPRAVAAGFAVAIDQLLADTGFAAQRDAISGTLAYGDRKRLELAMVLALEPAVLFLDEPTAGMSAAERHATVELLKAVKRKRSLSMLMTEHDMDVVFGLADRISVLHYGQLIASGTPAEIRANDKVKEVYLGDEEDAHA
ncbi:branched-chain amino acid transport system ATP-binding protein [Variovorax sp. GrIS 2.14]|uniref:ABC transporter ATP-binding protein n=1 Tax=Variovorax sp. GrIS 2.14 TaxID=3071709 RepID=UPI0019A3AE1F|nr:ABC transporter ATP-binding protein [Rhodoferax sp.]